MKGFLYVSCQPFREDWARVIVSLKKEFEKKKLLNLKLILSHKANAQARKYYKSFESIKMSQVKTNFTCFKISNIISFFAALKEKKILISKNLLKSFFYFSSSRNLLQKEKPNFLCSIKFTDNRELLAAADSLNIETYSIQHGLHYEAKKLKKLHEWPVKNYFVFSKKSRDYFQKRYPQSSKYINLNTVLWHARYRGIKIPKKKDTIIIFESSYFSRKKFLELQKYLPGYNLKIKKHPYFVLMNKSFGDNYAKNELLKKEFYLWNEIPLVGISIESTSTDELLYLGVVCITLCTKAYIGTRYPKTGSFSIDTDIEAIAFFLKQLLENPVFYKKILKKQQMERREFAFDSYPEKKIVNFICKKHHKNSLGSKSIP